MMLNMDFVIRLLVAGILGAIIGLDREYRAKEAGYRTHFLVSLGSALIMIVSQYGFQEIIKESSVTLDPSRVAAQVVSGIGFIGAGTIIFQKQIVRGLTTAAGIWATAGIGLAVGAGMYTIGIAATVLTLVGLELLSYLFKSIGMKSSMVSFSTPNKDILKQIADRFNSKDYLIVSYEMETQHTGETEYYQVTMVIKSKRNNDEGHLLSLIQEFPDVTVQRVTLKSVFVVQGICYSKKMKTLWNQLKEDERVGVTFDLYDLGLLFFDKTKIKQHYIVNF